MIPARLRTIIGATTTLLFLGIGLTLIQTPNAERIGALLCALGIFRGVFVARDLWPGAEAEEPTPPPAPPRA